MARTIAAPTYARTTPSDASSSSALAASHHPPSLESAADSLHFLSQDCHTDADACHMSRYESALLAGLSACIMYLLVNGLTFGTSVMVSATIKSNVPSWSFHHSRSAPLLRHHQFKACASLGRSYCDMRLSKSAITLPAYSDMRDSSIIKTLNATLIMVLVPQILALCTCLHEPSECRR